MSDPGPAGEEERRGWRKHLKNVGDWFSYKDKGEWLKDMKGAVSMTASIIATMTFQLATNPPGGVVQANLNETATTIPCNPSFKNKTTCPGYAVMAFENISSYRDFLVYNTISFTASVSVCLLLVSGIPLNHRFPTWLLSIGMCIALTSLTATYVNAASMITPSDVWDCHHIYGVWRALLYAVVFFLFMRFFVWGVKKCSSCCKKCSSCCK